MIIYGVEREIEVCDECEQSYILVDRRCECGKILCTSCYSWHKESIGGAWIQEVYDLKHFTKPN